jgi:thiol-disulfide isomerase/thioredoxin
MKQKFPAAKFILTGVLLIAIYYGSQIALKAIEGPAVPDVSTTDAASATAPADRSKVHPITVSQLETIMKTDKKPTLVFIYASWCPYCRQQFPIITGLQAEYGEKLNVVATSIDRTEGELQEFVNAQQPLPFAPYYVPAKENGMFRDWLGRSGADFQGGIPYSVLFDANGKLVTSFPGLTQADAFKSAINPISTAAPTVSD